MFVRVIFRGTGTMYQETIYECERVKFAPHETKSDRVFLGMEPCGITLELEKPKSEVYLMNNQGKTIDSYRWGE